MTARTVPQSFGKHDAINLIAKAKLLQRQVAKNDNVGTHQSY